MLRQKVKSYRFPVEIISYCVWSYHRFNDSYRDVAERMAYRGLVVSHETIRSWCLRFGGHFRQVTKKRERKPTDKWDLDEMVIRINGEHYVLWRVVDATGHELDILVQKNKCVATHAKDLTTSLLLNRSPDVATAIFMLRTPSSHATP